MYQGSAKLSYDQIQTQVNELTDMEHNGVLQKVDEPQSRYISRMGRQETKNYGFA